MKYYCIIIFLLSSCLNSFSEATTVEVKDIDKIEGKYNAKIIFPVEVNWETVGSLIESIDSLNNNYKNIDKIYLYINSNGGDVSAGYAAYQAVKSSRVPITTVNMGHVISAASMIYCGSKERLSFPGGYFYLHAPYIMTSDRGTLQDVARTKDFLNNSIAKIQETYSECVMLGDVDKDALYSSEDKRLTFEVAEATRRNMINGIAANGMEPSKVTIFIKDQQEQK